MVDSYEMKKIAFKKGYKFVMMKNVSDNPVDEYLKIVMLQDEAKNEYITYLYNDNDKAFYAGNYFISYEEAYKDFLKRK